MRKSPEVHSAYQLGFWIAMLFVLVITYAVTVAIERTADQAAARNMIDALLRDTCTHPVIGCRVT